MGTTLTGTTIKTTYNGLIKLADNGTMEAVEKTLTDGLGNDSALKLGTAGIQVTGTLKDSSGDVGASGQFLSSTATGTNWVDVVIPAGVFEVGSGATYNNIQQATLNSDATASSEFGFAMGNNSYAAGPYSRTFGENVTAGAGTTYHGTASGYNSTASSDYATASGYNVTASGAYSFAHGKNTAASGEYSFAQGFNTYATGAKSVSFNGGVAGGASSFAHNGASNGKASIAIGEASRAGTTDTGNSYDDSQISIGLNSYAQGVRAVALGSTSYGNTTAQGSDSVAIGYGATASGNYSTAFAYSTASGNSSFAFNAGTASGEYSTASGLYTNASGAYSFGYGKNITASGDYSFAHGSNTTASGDYSFAFSGGQATGGRSMASMTGVAAGHGSIALGYASRAGNADGGSPYGDGQIAIGTNSYAYGQFGMAIGTAAFGNSTASGNYGIALGGYGTASGNYSIAISGTASGDSSLAINGGTASGYYAVAIKTGLSMADAAGEQSFVIGNGGQTTDLAVFSGVINSGLANHQGVVCIQADSNRDSAVFVNELSIMSIPTSAAGLPTGAVWRNGTVLNIVP